MIFVTVGTHEQQFDRLVRGIDELKGKGLIKEEVMIQTGYSNWVPKHCKWSQWLSYRDMLKFVADARIVITHGGPSSFIMPMKMGKIPVVVPRKKEYEEHVNNHQVEFAQSMNKEGSRFITVENMEDMEDVLTYYDWYAAQCRQGAGGNNLKFNQALMSMVDHMMQNVGEAQRVGA